MLRMLRVSRRYVTNTVPSVKGIILILIVILTLKFLEMASGTV